ncbi:MAG: hypothetical protein ACRCSF_03300 [Mycobacteriaceae bacterium]
MNQAKKEPQLSFARLAVLSLGAATLVLLMVVITLAVLKPGPVIALILACSAVALSLTTMAVVSRRLVDRALQAEVVTHPTVADQVTEYVTEHVEGQKGPVNLEEPYND